MNVEFSVASPTASIGELQKLVVERNQRFVPVIENGRLAGAITRTDLLRHLVAGMEADYRPSTVVGGGGTTLKKRQIVRLLHEQLPAEIQVKLREMGEVADALGQGVFAVGGFVRDLLLRQENLDIDIVVEGDGIAFARQYARRHDCRVRTHKKFGTAVIIFSDGFKVDVASTRMEYYLEPGALPTVEHASIKLDLYRRDFTINTLAMALNRENYGELLDFFGAQKDLKEKAVRVLHNLSFVEDPTRVFRAIRFEQRLGFQMGKHTEHLLRSSVRMGFLEKVGGARVFNELVNILKEADPLPAVLRMADLDLLKFIHPALEVSRRTRSLFNAGGRAMHWYELLYTGETFHRWQVYFLCLTADLDGDAIRGIGSRLSIPGRYLDVFADQRSDAQRILNLLERRRARGNEPRPSDLYKWLDPFCTEILLYLMARAGTEEVRRWIATFINQLRDVEVVVTGHDLADLGIAPGPVYKKIKQALLDARLNGKVTTREDELGLVRKRFLKDRKSVTGGW
jgi:tRNA nucleotidyltransferase (CCA-adding enzyme)